MSVRYEFPGFVDVHVHFRDSGVPEAETTASGLAAAARGGFAAVVTMPNTTPAVDSAELVRYQLDRASAAGGDLPRLLPSACISRGRLGSEVADLEALAEAGAVFFTDDGTYVSDAKVLEEAMRRAYDLNMVVCQHALAPGFTEAEAIRRDLSVCRETGCRYHVQHISTAAGVELIRGAQEEGLPVTAEATPHHLLLCRDDIPDDLFAGGVPAEDELPPRPWPADFKMAPPLATREDRTEVRRAVKDGVLMFATDHAPHPAAKKRLPYAEAANGILGLETAVAITYHVMVEEEGMPIVDWARAWWEKPAALLAGGLVERSRKEVRNGLPVFGKTVIEIGEDLMVDPERFASLSRNCPYYGMRFRCRPVTGDEEDR